MSAFSPPYPPRPPKTLGPLDTIKYLRKDLLSLWPEKAFSQKFLSIKIINHSLFIANSPDSVEHVLITNQANYEKKLPLLKKTLAPLLGDSLFLSDGDSWQHHSQLAKPLFGPEQIAAFSEAMVKTITEWTQRWAALPNNSRLQMLPEMKQLSATILCRILFGERFNKKQIEELVTALDAFQSAIEDVDINTFFGLPSWIPSFGGNKPAKTAKAVHDIIDQAIRNGKPDDGSLLGHFLALTDKGLSQQQIRYEIITLFMAGYESTANTLTWVWYLLSQAPEVEERLHLELSEVLGTAGATFADYPKLTYTRAIIDETLRLYPPFPLLMRETAADDTIRNRPVPAGSIMLIVPWLLHRHKEYWEQPDYFIPERFLPDAPVKPIPMTYLPFSVGARECIAKYFSTVEMTLCLASLAQQFRLQAKTGEQVTPICRLLLRPDHNLAMELIKRNKTT